jgi:ankyrin repeat protein
LLEAGANLSISSSKDGDTPLIIACSEGHAKVAQKLIDAGAVVNGPNAGGWTPLIYAAYYGHRAVVEMLLASEAVINQVSSVSRLVC